MDRGEQLPSVYRFQLDCHIQELYWHAIRVAGSESGHRSGSTRRWSTKLWKDWSERNDASLHTRLLLSFPLRFRSNWVNSKPWSLSRASGFASHVDLIHDYWFTINSLSNRWMGKQRMNTRVLRSMIAVWRKGATASQWPLTSSFDTG